MASVTGVGTVVKRLMTAKSEVASGMERGLVKAGLMLQRASQQLVPLDTGALKNSAFTRKVGSGFSTDVQVGYTQEYAVFVHENLEAHHPIGQAKFLEQPARDLRPDMIALIRAEARLR